MVYTEDKQTEVSMGRLMEAFKRFGLLDCLNGTGVTSENYKEVLMKSQNEFLITNETIGPGIQKSEIEINDLEYEVSQDAAAICHCLMLVEETLAKLVK